MTTPTPTPAAVRTIATWSPSQSGRCARCHAECCRYGVDGNPLCESCKDLARQAQSTNRR